MNLTTRNTLGAALLFGGLSLSSVGFSTDSKTTHVCARSFEPSSILDRLYADMTQVSDWAGVKQRNYFRYVPSVDLVILEVADEYADLATFISGRLANPERFIEFLRGLADPVSGNIPVGDTLRSELARVLQRHGFTFEDTNRLLADELFYERLSRGVITVEGAPHLLTNGHGHDTHLIQLAYLSAEASDIFGPHAVYDLIRYIGRVHSMLWVYLFDSTFRADLSNPMVVNRFARTLGLQ